MKIERPLWTRGVMVSPQHFQCQAAFAAWHAECIAQTGVMNPWGVLRAELDADALKQGRVKASHLAVRFPDGTLIDSDMEEEMETY